MSIALEHMNTTELRQLILRHTGYRVKAGLPKARLVELAAGTGATPTKAEISGTSETRAKLQQWVSTNWKLINSQIPCEGENKGRCTVYPCSDGKHLDCFTAAGECKT